jgi:tripartite-type tricarboxylate transporter receptor subunit TctC
VSGPRLTKIHADVTAALREPQARERFAAQGLEVHGSSVAEFARYLRAEVAKWSGVVQVAGLTPQ